MLVHKPYTEAEHRAWTGPFASNPTIRAQAVQTLRSASNEPTLEAAERLKTFKKPVLLAWAKGDKIFGPQWVERLNKLFENSTVAWISNSQAFMPRDNPEELARVMDEWLASHPVKPTSDTNSRL
jgi:pimeloyl-ACP methyl ester carboxylesterase